MATRVESSESATGRMRLPDLVALAVVWIPYAVLVRHFWFLTDDSFISFRYARNWAAGQGLRFNIGPQPPVEGYSNFLWLALAAVFEWLGANVAFWMPLVSFALGSALLCLLYTTLRLRLEMALPIATLAVASLALFPPFFIWSTGGLATVPAALLLFLTFERLVIRDVASPVTAGVTGLLLALIRIEGIAWAILVGLAFVTIQLMSSDGSTTLARRLRPLIPYSAIVGGGFAVYSLARVAYYAAGTANTASAKLGLDPAYLARGFDYVAAYHLVFLTPFLIIPLAVIAVTGNRPALALTAFAFFAANVGFAVAVGGDFMAMGRLMVATLPFAALLLALALERLWGGSSSVRLIVTAATVALIWAGSSVATGDHLVPLEVQRSFNFRGSGRYPGELVKWRHMRANTRRWSEIGRTLKRVAEPDATMVRGAIGATGYYSELYIYDVFGLVSREVAAQPVREFGSPGHDKRVTRLFFLDRQPTYMQANLATRQSLRIDSGHVYETAGRIADRGHHYVPEFHRTEEGNFLVLLRRAPDGGDYEQLIADSREQLRKLRRRSAPKKGR